VKGKKIGIALGGGGILGVAHIGVLEVLEEHGITPAVVTGSSAGSIVGALYAAGVIEKYKATAPAPIKAGT
jgi:NTE family protein